MIIDQRKTFLIIFLLGLLLSPVFAQAAEVGESRDFYVDPGYDIEQREQVTAELKHISDKAYLYVEQEWYDQLEQDKKEEVEQHLENLGQEFDDKIHPKLTEVYGEEWSPGIDDDPKITILFHQLQQNSAGYFRSNDEYERIRVPGSNEREMSYLNTKYLTKDILKSYVAHEFTHVITFNQKNRLRNVQEEVWLNEARAEYAPALLNYDSNFAGSNLQQRIRDFLNYPSDSIIGWRGQQSDYGALRIFTQYLVDHYGERILIDSLFTGKTGVESINYALKENAYDKKFSGVFTDWTIASFLNDCEVKEEYCYKNKHLSSIDVTPSSIFVPSTQEMDMNLAYFLEQWSGNWYRIMGGNGDLSLQIDGADNVDFEIPYVACKNGDCSIDEMKLNFAQDGQLELANFNDYESLTLIPSIQEKQIETKNKLKFGFSVSISTESEEEKQRTRELRQKVAELQARVDELLKKLEEKKQQQKKQKYACSQIDRNLKVGMRGEQVECLQQFLKDQDDIYPQGLVTGYFGPLTKQAVIRFQERYQSEILAPWSLQNGTGYVGRTTKQQINKMIQ